MAELRHGHFSQDVEGSHPWPQEALNVVGLGVLLLLLLLLLLPGRETLQGVGIRQTGSQGGIATPAPGVSACRRARRTSAAPSAGRVLVGKANAAPPRSVSVGTTRNHTTRGHSALAAQVAADLLERLLADGWDPCGYGYGSQLFAAALAAGPSELVVHVWRCDRKGLNLYCVSGTLMKRDLLNGLRWGVRA